MKLIDFIKPKPQEQILMMVRESFSAHVPFFLFYAFWFLVPFFFFYPLFREGVWGELVFGMLVVSGGFLFWRSFHAWSHTLFVITDQRIIDIDQKGFFDRVVTESSFDQMKDVYYRMHGVWAMIFGYGTVYIQMHGDVADLKFEHVKRPARVQDLLNDLRHEKHD